ncbi:uncharacterized protein [Periplaneta americana]|uniref:uncharacterized protein n=1 Tax=Periplaneta americana TaxID=6978 RepID=UPI0037E838E9
MFTKLFGTLLVAQVHYIALGQNDVYRIPYDYAGNLKNKDDYLRDYDFMGAAYNEEKKKDFADGRDNQKIRQPLFIEEKRLLPVKDIHYTITDPLVFDEDTGTLTKNSDHRKTDRLLDEGKKDIFVRNTDGNQPIFTDLNELLRIYKPTEIVEKTDRNSVKQNKRKRMFNKKNNSVNRRYLVSNPEEKQLNGIEKLYVPERGGQIDLNNVKNVRRTLMGLLRNRNIIVNIHHLNAILRRNIKETNDGVVNKHDIQFGGNNLKSMNKKETVDDTRYSQHMPHFSNQGDYNAMHAIPGPTEYQTVQSFVENPEDGFEREEYPRQHHYKFNINEEERYGMRNQQKEPSYYFVENQNREVYAPYMDDAKDNNFKSYSQYYGYRPINHKRKKHGEVNYITYPRGGYKIKNAGKYYETEDYGPRDNVRNKYGSEKYVTFPINEYGRQNYVKYHYLPRYHERYKPERKKYGTHTTNGFRNENANDAKDNNFKSYSQYYGYPPINRKRKKHGQVNYITYPRGGYKIKNAGKYYETEGYGPRNNVRKKYGTEKYATFPINEYERQNYVKYHYLPRYHERNKPERRKFGTHTANGFRNENARQHYVIHPNNENIKQSRYLHLDTDTHDEELHPYLTRSHKKHKNLNIIRQFGHFLSNLQGIESGMERHETYLDNEVKENNEMEKNTSQFSEFLKNIIGISRENNLMILVPDTRSGFGVILSRFLTYHDYENEEEEEEKEEREN